MGRGSSGKGTERGKVGRAFGTPTPAEMIRAGRIPWPRIHWHCQLCGVFCFATEYHSPAGIEGLECPTPGCIGDSLSAVPRCGLCGAPLSGDVPACAHFASLLEEQRRQRAT